MTSVAATWPMAKADDGAQGAEPPLGRGQHEGEQHRPQEELTAGQPEGAGAQHRQRVGPQVLDVGAVLEQQGLADGHRRAAQHPGGDDEDEQVEERGRREPDVGLHVGAGARPPARGRGRPRPLEPVGRGQERGDRHHDQDQHTGPHDRIRRDVSGRETQARYCSGGAPRPRATVRRCARRATSCSSRVDQWRGDCLSAMGHPVVRTPNLDRLAAGGRAVRQPLGPGGAVRAEPGLPLHRHLPAPEPVGAQRHAARRPLHQHRPRGPRRRLRPGAVRLHRRQRRPSHGRRPTTPACAPTRGCCPGFRAVLDFPFETADAVARPPRGARLPAPDAAPRHLPGRPRRSRGRPSTSRRGRRRSTRPSTARRRS